VNSPPDIFGNSLVTRLGDDKLADGRMILITIMRFLRASARDWNGSHILSVNSAADIFGNIFLARLGDDELVDGRMIPITIARFLHTSAGDWNGSHILSVNSAADIFDNNLLARLGHDDLADGQLLASPQHVGLGGEVLPLLLARLFVQERAGKTRVWDIYGSMKYVVDATTIVAVPEMVLEDGCVAPKCVILIGGGRQDSSSTLCASNQLTKVDTHFLHHNLFIRMPRGTITLLVEATASIAAIKTQLANRVSIPAHEQRLLLAGKQLHDRDTMEMCGAGNDSTLQLMLRLGGGMDGDDTPTEDVSTVNAMRDIHDSLYATRDTELDEQSSFESDTNVWMNAAAIEGPLLSNRHITDTKDSYGWCLWKLLQL
jgi:hypothetical protein